MIKDLDKIITQSLMYISHATSGKVFDIVETYTTALNKQYDKQTYFKHKYTFTTEEEEHIKLNALQITGRYYRMKYGLKGERFYLSS